jgi:tetratricopeptide (TPR) repeat protein
MVEALLKAVSNGPNQAILGLLAVEGAHPRRIGVLLGLPEGEVARRLRRLEGLGLVKGQWARRGETNVKEYRLAATRLTLRFAATGLEVDLDGSSAQKRPALATNMPPAPLVVGRSKELAALQGPEAVHIVLGMPGVGKTTLLAHHAAQQGRPVFWRSLRGVESVTWIANQVALFVGGLGDRGLLDALDADSSGAAAAGATLEAMERSGALFVLDDVHKATDPALRAFIADAVAHIRKARLLVGSRDWIAHDPSRPGLRIHRLAGLADAEALDLLRRQGVQAEEGILSRLRDEAGGHPLALNLLAQAALQSGDLDTLLDRVPERDLQEWLVSEVEEHLGEEERRVLFHASLFRTPFTAADLAAVGGKRADGAVAKLRRRMLLLDVPGGHALAEVIQNHCYAKLEDKATLHARAARHALQKGTLESRLEAMHHHLLAGDRSKVLELVERNLDLHEYAYIDAGYQNLYKEVLDSFQRRDVPDRQWALVLDERGDIALHRGDAQAALPLYEEALGIFRRLRDQAGCADAGWKLALCLERIGRAAEAVELCGSLVEQAPEGEGRKRLQELHVRLRA